jgi:hypothetical protein
MRWSVILATAALGLTFSTGARAEHWCGYAAHAKSMIECGYSSVTDCESAVGKGGMCFLDPSYALNAKRRSKQARRNTSDGA